MVIAGQFAKAFRHEHREIRDALLELSRAFARRLQSEIAVSLVKVARLTGPHLRYEEEALYPALSRLFGPDYIVKLRTDHHRAIGSMRRLVDLASRNTLTVKAVSAAMNRIREVLPYIADCEGYPSWQRHYPPPKLPRSSRRAIWRCRSMLRCRPGRRTSTGMLL